MKPSSRLVGNTTICGYQQNLYINETLPGIHISESRNMIVARKFLESLIEKYGKHSVYSDGGTWYPEACKVLKLKHYIHSPLEKSFIER